MPEIKNTLNRINNSLDAHDEKINKLKDTAIETTWNEREKINAICSESEGVYIWLSILCINVGELWVPETWPHTILGLSVRVFLNELTSELVDWVKQIVLLVSHHPINWKPEQNKKTDPPWTAPGWLVEMEYRFFPAFACRLKHQPFLGLQPASVQTGTYTIHSLGSPACQPTVGLGTSWPL